MPQVDIIIYLPIIYLLIVTLVAGLIYSDINTTFLAMSMQKNLNTLNENIVLITIADSQINKLNFFSKQ